MYLFIDNNGEILKGSLTEVTEIEVDNNFFSSYNSECYIVIDGIPTLKGNADEIVAKQKEEIKNRELAIINAQKLVDGEKQIDGIIQDAVNAINTKYGVKFASIHNMAMYVLVTDYPLRTQCEAMINWSANLWATARLNQESVMNGIMSEEEFMALLPAVPEI